jgi:hypothetical protein
MTLTVSGHLTGDYVNNSGNTMRNKPFWNKLSEPECFEFMLEVCKICLVNYPGAIQDHAANSPSAAE